MADSARFVCKISTSVAPRLERPRAKTGLIWPSHTAQCISRARACARHVYWQAEFAGRPAPNVIKAAVGEDWVLERTAVGLKFIIYINTFHRLPPESTQLDL